MPPSTPTQNVGNPYKTSGRRGSALRSVKVQFRLSANMYSVLRQVPNVSEFLRRLVYDTVETLPMYFEIEEFRLEVEVAELCDELNRVHSYAKSLLKHGSYAQAYLKKLEGCEVVDRSPFHLREPPPEVSKMELETVKAVVEVLKPWRRELARFMHEEVAFTFG